MADQPRKRRDLSLQPATPEELDALSEISMADVARARMAWEQVAPPEMRPLPDAVVEP